MFIHQTSHTSTCS